MDTADVPAVFIVIRGKGFAAEAGDGIFCSVGNDIQICKKRPDKTYKLIGNIQGFSIPNEVKQ